MAQVLAGIFLYLVLAIMPKRAKGDIPDLIADDGDLHRELASCTTRTGLAKCLATLGERGWLTDDSVANNTRSLYRKLNESSEHHSKQDTVYGKVAQSMELPGLKRWDYCHPMALMHYLCRISGALASMMAACSTAAIPMRIVIYIDEICPGNPLRPEKSRTLQAIYWTFVDFPD